MADNITVIWGTLAPTDVLRNLLNYLSLGAKISRMTRADVNGEIENVYYTGAKLRAHFNRLVTFFW